MSFDAHALPVPDLGLRCLQCGYPLAGLSVHRCPECGRQFSVDEHIPSGDFPVVIIDGKPALVTPEIMELMQKYQIVFTQRTGPMENVYSMNLSLAGKCELAVARERYFEVIDLLRRRETGEPMPEPPIVGDAAAEWTCKTCGEENPGNFELCWSCGEAAQHPVQADR